MLFKIFNTNRNNKILIITIIAAIISWNFKVFKDYKNCYRYIITGNLFEFIIKIEIIRDYYSTIN